jgi:hypothetical protein
MLPRPFLQQRHKLTKEAMKDIFDVVAFLLPEDNELCSYDEALKMMELIGGVQIQRIDCCVGDCCLYENAPLKFDPDRKRQLAEATICPNPACLEPRYDVNGKPRKIYRKIPIGPQLAKRFCDPTFAGRIRLKRGGGAASDLWNSPGWKRKVWDDVDFAEERRNILLSFCADGVNPFQVPPPLPPPPSPRTVRTHAHSTPAFHLLVRMPCTHIHVHTETCTRAHSHLMAHS